ncbi:hypothetical protein KYLE_33 [Pantoea phage Kyle]|uniref:Capsid maturation protease n=1 Tax=Pantoea phage Kyle TaxID=2589665 RepID=A0A514A8R1_9CAUD|nr:head maturation protease [Pantoea phage Kyle]QDH49614.1 hypothetical protein KYLE_33 [Pantoea phage Kyle]
MQGTSREIDKNGFMTIKGCPLSSFGIFEYSAGQVGLPGDPHRIVNVYRPESEVNNVDAINSFRNVPFIDDHEMLSGFEGDEENSAPEDYGVDGVLTSEVYYAKPWMRGDLKVFARKLRRAIDSGKVDLSLGYDCEFVVQSGTFDGKPYEVIQQRLRGNHIALVDIGRVPGARVLDGRCFDHLSLSVLPSNEDNPMPQKGITKPILGKGMDKAAKDNAIEQLKALIPALEQALSEEGGEPASEQPSEQPSVSVEQTPEGSGEGETKVEVEPGSEVSEHNDEPPTNEGEQPSGEGELSGLISRVKAVLEKLESGAATDESEVKPGEAEDRTEGLVDISAPAGSDLKVDDKPTEVEKASPGPSAGTHKMANDSAVRAIRADIARADNLYKRVSKVTGAFDHAAMSASDVARYGVQKLKIKCQDGAEFDALDAYLNGLDAAARQQTVTTSKRAADSAAESAEFDAWLKGTK